MLLQKKWKDQPSHLLATQWLQKMCFFASSPLVLVQLFDAVVLHAKLHIQPCKRHKQTGEKKKCFCWRHFMFRIPLEVTVLYGVSLYYATGNGPRLSVVPVTKDPRKVQG